MTNHDLKGLLKGAATMASVRPGPFQDFYQASLAKGIKPTMARLTLARAGRETKPAQESSGWSVSWHSEMTCHKLQELPRLVGSIRIASKVEVLYAFPG